jgi:hypothetical protein
MEERRTVILESHVIEALRNHPDVEDFSFAYGVSDQGLMIEFKETAGLPIQVTNGIRCIMISIFPDGFRVRWTDLHGNPCVKEWSPSTHTVTAIEAVLADPASAAINAVVDGMQFDRIASDKHA